MAWAHEGIAKVLTKQGDLGMAQDHMEQAIHIRMKQAAATTGQSHFRQELVEDQKVTPPTSPLLLSATHMPHTCHALTTATITRGNLLLF